MTPTLKTKKAHREERLGVGGRTTSLYYTSYFKDKCLLERGLICRLGSNVCM